jgi:PhzF family phenazine biosynthesis protein
MEVRVEAWRSFVNSCANRGGNLAGVVLDPAEELQRKQMVNVASATGFSETAFIQGVQGTSSPSQIKLRFATPKAPINLCGHATVAAVASLLQRGRIGVGTHTVETRAGMLPVEARRDGSIYYEQLLPTFLEEPIDVRRVAQALKLQPENIGIGNGKLTPRIVSIVPKLRDMLIPLNVHWTTLEKLQPDVDSLRRLARRDAYNVLGFHMYVLPGLGDIDVYCRHFAQLNGIVEDLATGSLAPPLVYELVRHRCLTAKSFSRAVIAQGKLGDDQSEICVECEGDPERITRMRVGGRARKTGVPQWNGSDERHMTV